MFTITSHSRDGEIAIWQNASGDYVLTTTSLPAQEDVQQATPMRILGKTLLGLFLGALSLLTFAGNVIVIRAVRVDRKLQTVS